MAGDGRRGCLRYGCLGCLGAAAVLGLFLAIAASALAWTLRGRAADMTSFERSQELPRIATPTAPGAEALPAPPVDGRPGRIVLEVSHTRFELVPAEPGTPLAVEARYDRKAYRLEESLKAAAESEWTYRLSFGSRGLMHLFYGGGAGPWLRLRVPKDVPVVLIGRVGTGESDFELGGLSIVALDLELGTGSHTLRFGEPAPVPMSTFHIDGSVGELSVLGLGNASPARVEVDHSLGEVRLDFSGRWLRDATIDVGCGIGDCDLTMPTDAAVEVEDLTLAIGQGRSEAFEREWPPGTPTLHVVARGSIGQVQVH